MNRWLVAGLFGVSLVSVAVASGTATPVAYGLGESTPATAATTWVSGLIALLSGGGGLAGLLKLLPSGDKIGKVVDFVRPIVDDKNTGDGISQFVEQIFGGRLDAATITEEGALLYVGVCRLKAGDAAGKDKAFELLQHVRESGKPVAKK